MRPGGSTLRPITQIGISTVAPHDAGAVGKVPGGQGATATRVRAAQESPGNGSHGVGPRCRACLPAKRCPQSAQDAASRAFQALRTPIPLSRLSCALWALQALSARVPVAPLPVFAAPRSRPARSGVLLVGGARSWPRSCPVVAAPSVEPSAVVFGAAPARSQGGGTPLPAPVGAPPGIAPISPRHREGAVAPKPRPPLGVSPAPFGDAAHRRRPTRKSGCARRRTRAGTPPRMPRRGGS